MKSLILLLSLLFPLASQALEANGSWTGSGLLIEGVITTQIQLKLEVELKETSFFLKACWYDGQKLSCHKSLRSRDFYDRLYNSKGQKVGDVYPFSLTLFESNRQVSEQILLKTNAKGQLFYSYTLINMDGGVSHQRGILERGRP